MRVFVYFAQSSKPAGSSPISHFFTMVDQPLTHRIHALFRSLHIHNPAKKLISFVPMAYHVLVKILTVEGVLFSVQTNIALAHQKNVSETM